MANICSNWIEIQGDESDIKKFFELVGKEFDCNKVIPCEDKDIRDKWGSSPAFDSDCDYEDGECWANWYFWTKWNPPALIYKKLVELFPYVSIVWRYEEPGNGLFGYLNDSEEEQVIKIWTYEEYVILEDNKLDGGEADIFLFSRPKICTKKVEERVKYWCKRLDLEEKDVERSLDSWNICGHDKDMKEDIEVTIKIELREVIPGE